MAFCKKKVTCTQCGAKLTVWIPSGMSPLGIEAISICDSCWRKLQWPAKRKEAAYGKDRPDEDN